MRLLQYDEVFKNYRQMTEKYQASPPIEIDRVVADLTSQIK